MQTHLFLAQASSFSTLDSVFAASVALGFAFALLLVLSSGRMPKVRLFKASRIRPIGPISRIAKSGRPTLWQTVPGAIPVGIGSFLIGFGLSGLALRTLPVADFGRATVDES